MKKKKNNVKQGSLELVKNVINVVLIYTCFNGVSLLHMDLQFTTKRQGYGAFLQGVC